MGCELVRPEVLETTAFGAAALAGLGVGFWDSKEKLAEIWRAERSFSPVMKLEASESLRASWDKAVERTKL
jgi:glycerol kinase